MRQVLIDYSRSRAAGKRFHQKVELKSWLPERLEPRDDGFEVEDALRELGRSNPVWEKLLRLRVFDGYRAKEAARAVGLAESTARREFARARHWLRRELRKERTKRSFPRKALARYRILKKLGSGVTATVYLAKDRRLRKLVAMKVFDPNLLRDPRWSHRLAREARCAAELTHPNIAAFHEMIHSEGMDFIVMEYVPGGDLSKAIPKGGFPVDVSIDYALQIAQGLFEAHSCGIIHRDLKPSNIRFADGKVLKLLDFGLAKQISVDNLASEDPVITRPGTVMGTVGYMSPEQVLGQPTDIRTDIFSFGAILYELLTGRIAFREESPIETMNAILHEKPPALPSRVPCSLNRIVSRCLRKNPKRRYRTITAVIADLKLVASGFLQQELPLRPKST
jgi:serine/threonine protein kinase